MAEGPRLGVRCSLRGCWGLPFAISWDSDNRAWVLRVLCIALSFYAAFPCEDCGKPVRGGCSWCFRCLLGEATRG